ncbi:helix-turn-helix domain-containing protein [Sporolactobacillus sp. CPB3-1]|uniref:Helix-turn-helix domain-containing protein n=1 Tax=Sporolactobacillus mangiferae TaxID=2940498 RepID=A0ABT0M9L5_9BACL|nr:helix-turn-helix domain-containing protein [Sporolactobacillus mangiferae]
MSKEEVNITDKLKRYKHLVSFLGEVMGDGTEIVLYAVQDGSFSVVALSGPSSDHPSSDSVDLSELLKKGKESGHPFMTNDERVIENGTVIKSSAYFIRDAYGAVIGLLNISVHSERMAQVIEYLKGWIDTGHQYAMAHTPRGPLPSIEDIAVNSIKEVISSMEVPPVRMSQKEKLEIIHKLNSNGIFKIKGIVSLVAQELKTSEATIYRYLSKMKKGEPDFDPDML